MLNRILVSLCLAASCTAQVSSKDQAAIDSAVQNVLQTTGGASASISIVKDGKPAYAHAYGFARLETNTPAVPEMRYKIASNSKQFLASAILMLMEDGKLSLDDPVARFLPGLTRAKDVTIRQLLSHTSGYEDYYPLDYVTPSMARDTTPRAILDMWAKKPLNFEPGTKWQYSNTNYTIAGQIVEKVTGDPLIEFLRKRIFQPLGMQSAIDVDSTPWSTSDPAGYTQFALGPERLVQLEGKGWMYAAGELAMTARDLSLWDISLMNGTLLKPASIAALTTEIKLKNGAGTGYALGLSVSNKDGHRRWSHTGGASGYLSINYTLPDDRMAVTVLTNSETEAFRMISQQIDRILLAKPKDPDATSSLEIAKKVFLGLQRGELDRSLVTEDAKAYFTAQAIADYASSLGPLGAPTEFRQTGAEERGGMTERNFAVRAGGKSLYVSTYWTGDGKLAQYLVRISGRAQ